MLQEIIKTPEECQLLAKRWAQLIQAGTVLGLIGPLGAGKTCFVQGLVAGLGSADLVSSPTFALIHEYDNTVPIYHFDLYRLKNFGELIGLGFEDYCRPDSICLIEWADLFPELEKYVTHRLEIVLEESGSRRLTLV